MKPYLVGYIELKDKTIYLDDIRGIYADRGSPRKPGHWIKLRDVESVKGIQKIYCEGLSLNDRRLADAAAKFNQTVESLT